MLDQQMQQMQQQQQQKLLQDQSSYTSLNQLLQTPAMDVGPTLGCKYIYVKDNDTVFLIYFFYASVVNFRRVFVVSELYLTFKVSL